MQSARFSFKVLIACKGLYVYRHICMYIIRKNFLLHYLQFILRRITQDSQELIYICVHEFLDTVDYLFLKIPKNLKNLLSIFYVLLLYIIYVMESGRFSQCPAFLSQTGKERDKKYSVKSQ